MTEKFTIYHFFNHKHRCQLTYEHEYTYICHIYTIYMCTKCVIMKPDTFYAGLNIKIKIITVISNIIVLY